MQKLFILRRRRKKGFPRFEGFPKRGVSKIFGGIQNLSGAGFETVEKTGVSKIFIRRGHPPSGAAFENSRGIQILIGGHPKNKEGHPRKKRGIQVYQEGASKMKRGIHGHRVYIHGAHIAVFMYVLF